MTRDDQKDKPQTRPPETGLRDRRRQGKWEGYDLVGSAEKPWLDRGRDLGGRFVGQGC